LECLPWGFLAENLSALIIDQVHLHRSLRQALKVFSQGRSALALIYVHGAGSLAGNEGTVLPLGLLGIGLDDRRHNVLDRNNQHHRQPKPEKYFDK